jgi:hypothetical protein
MMFFGMQSRALGYDAFSILIVGVPSIKGVNSECIHTYNDVYYFSNNKPFLCFCDLCHR